MMRESRWVRAASLGASLLLLAGCSTATARHAATTSDPALTGQWALSGAQDKRGELDLENEDITLTVSPGRIATGRSSCSDYRAKMFGTLARLWVDTAITRRAKCGSTSAAQVERRYLAALRSVYRASVVGGVLSMSSADAFLQFVRAPLPPVSAISEHDWELYAVVTRGRSGGPLFAVGTAASIRFTKGGHFIGTTGCRPFFGSFRTDAGDLVASQLSLSGSNCGTPLGALDREQVKVLGTVFTVQVSWNQLVLSNARDGILLIYEGKR